VLFGKNFTRLKSSDTASANSRFSTRKEPGKSTIDYLYSEKELKCNSRRTIAISVQKA